MTLKVPSRNSALSKALSNDNLHSTANLIILEPTLWIFVPPLIYKHCVWAVLRNGTSKCPKAIDPSGAGAFSFWFDFICAGDRK